MKTRLKSEKDPKFGSQKIGFKKGLNLPNLLNSENGRLSKTES